ncbi:hypothetical protein V8C37DRAFT_414087 [Trichoderma ceciliae]
MACFVPWKDWKDPLGDIGHIIDSPVKGTVEDPEIDEETVYSDPDHLIIAQGIVKEILSSYRRLGPRDNTIELLNIFLSRLPREGHAALLCDIIAVRYDDANIRALRRYLIDTILKPFQLAGGNQTYPLLHEPIDSSMPHMEEFHMTSLECLLRDGYRCIITGHYDKASIRDRTMTVPSGIAYAPTQGAHILPFALGMFGDRHSSANRRKSLIWQALYRYFPALKGKIGGFSINQPENMVSMSLNVYSKFGGCEMALWPLNKTGPVEECVELRSANSTLPLPDKEFFRTHCIISEILQVSGILDESEAEYEDLYSDDSADVESLAAQLGQADIY